MRAGVTVALLLGLGGCASVAEGTSQVLSVDSNPQGARCELFRDGNSLGAATTPGTVEVSKSRKDITVTCTKPGYAESTAIIESDMAATLVAARAARRAGGT